MKFISRLTPSILFLYLAIGSTIAHASSAPIDWVGCGISKKAYMTDMAAQFKKETSIDINVQGGGATRGIRNIAEGSADMGGSCRYHLPDNELENSVSFEPVAWDALAVIAHKDNPIDNITIEQLQDIYSGKITNWKQLGGHDAKIDLLARKGKISGVGYMIRKLLFYDAEMNFPASHFYKSSGPLEKATMENINSISISGISSARLRDLKILKLNGFSPDTAAIRSGKYLLYRPLYITYRKDSNNINVIKKFIAFVHSREGRSLMLKNGVVPYLIAMPLIFKQIEQERIASRSTFD